MTKRKAEYQLDRDNYNEQALNTNINDNELANDNDKIWTSEEISQRKIYRAKRTVTTQKESAGGNQGEKGKFKIIGSLEDAVSKNKQEDDKNKDQSNEQKQKVNPFAKKSTDTKSSSLFGTKDNNSNEKSVFLNKPNDNEKEKTISIFGKPLETSNEIKKTSIFGPKKRVYWK